MKGHDKNMANITRRIRAMAKKKTVFCLGDLVRAHMCVHHCYDWEERLAYLVSTGRLRAKPAAKEEQTCLCINWYSVNPIS